jgi:hypothetical protein
MNDDPEIRCRTCRLWRPPSAPAAPRLTIGLCQLTGIAAAQAPREPYESCTDHAPLHTIPPITAQTLVWDTPSGMGGTFTVMILDDKPDEKAVTVRVCYGRITETGHWHRWLDWDGYIFTTTRDQLSKPRRLGDRSRRAA